MREIKFRGKRLDNGEWVVGFYWVEETRNNNHHHIYTFEKGKDSKELIRITGNFVVDPATVGQYTGLKENGVEIYEGDIIQDICERMYSWEPNIFIGSVGWDDTTMTYQIKAENGNFIYLSEAENYEVIGNIHDNPELLDG